MDSSWHAIPRCTPPLHPLCTPSRQGTIAKEPTRMHPLRPLPPGRCKPTHMHHDQRPHMMDRKGQGRSSTTVVLGGQPASMSSWCLAATRSAALSHRYHTCRLCK